MVAKKLLIIGNGFDLQCGLKSSYTDFFESDIICKRNELVNKFFQDVQVFKSKSTSPYTLQYISISITNLKDLKESSSEFLKKTDIGFWNLIFGISKNTGSDWNNVERTIENIVCNLSSSSITIEKINGYYYKLQSKNNNILVEKHSQVNFDLALYLFFLKSDIPDLYVYLLKELKKFEYQFKQYLSKVVTSNKSYNGNVTKLLKKISSENSNVINFNYTTIKNTTTFNQQSHVHGSLKKSSIIFGIDSSNLSHLDKYFIFSKTYRKMHSFEDVNITKYIGGSMLDRNINNISFYGHSLNESDYSYFQSIFDFYDIYNSGIFLVFYYSIYDSEKTNDIKENHTNAVINLLNNYGKTMANKYHGTNFLHKLMLENRVILKKF